MTYIFDTMAPRNFDKVSDLFVGDFVRDVKDNLDLDEESIELMDKAMERMKQAKADKRANKNANKENKKNDQKSDD